MEGLDKKRDKHEVLLFEQHGRSLHEELTDEVDGISADFSCAEQVAFSFRRRFARERRAVLVVGILCR